MDLKDGVIYVAPSGVAFDSECVNRYKEIFNGIAEKIVNIVVPIARKIAAFVKGFIEKVWEFIKGLDYKEIQKRAEDRERMRKSWQVPKSNLRMHQVLSRKPFVSHAKNQI